MKKRTASPLLRASALMTGGFLGCSSQASPAAEPNTNTPNERMELADTRRVTATVSVPDGVKPTGPIRVELRPPGGKGPPLATGEFPVEGRLTTIRWDVDPSVKLPKRLHASVVVPVADAPSPRDLIGEATDAITSSFVLLLRPKIALVRVDLEHDDTHGPPQPVYANTKGSHHMQDRLVPVDPNAPPKPTPPPPPVTTVTVHAPGDASGFLVLRVSVLAGQKVLFRKFIGAPSMPAELELHPPLGESWPKDAIVRVESGEGTKNTLAAELPVAFGAKATARLTPQR